MWDIKKTFLFIYDHQSLAWDRRGNVLNKTSIIKQTNKKIECGLSVSTKFLFLQQILIYSLKQVPSGFTTIIRI